MSYTIIISKSVQKDLNNLPNELRERVAEKIQRLAEDPRPDGVVKLKGMDNEYRIRVGDYRVRYEVDDASTVEPTAFSGSEWAIASSLPHFHLSTSQ
jgi:mRNA interferase RelE/StbE